jgi:prepilin-type processing-associated H-X9-DG protein
LQRKTGKRRPLGHSPRRPGISAAEVLVVLAIVAMLAVFVLMSLPRQRESARLASCQRNLMQIGIALAMYNQAERHLPTVPELSGEPTRRADSPLRALLEALALPDFGGLSDPKNVPPKGPGFVPAERPVTGFACPSDPNATSRLFPAPISYRATTGDGPEGRDGAFAPGRRIAIEEIEAGDGTSYTAAFSERLVGTGKPRDPVARNYAVVPGPLGDSPCPSAEPASWRGDAGSSWLDSNWRSTLYNHALTPDASPSCLAADGRSAFMGASSGHVERVNVLLFDGSVRLYTPRVHPNVWRALASTNTHAAAPAAPGKDEPTP